MQPSFTYFSRCFMKSFLSLVAFMAIVFSIRAQCEFIDVSVSFSSETQVQLYTPTPFLVPNPEATLHSWDISDSNGNTIVQETTDSDGNFFLFDHNVALSDTIIACLSITNELAGPGISCNICTSLVWGGDIVNWELVEIVTGTFEATEPPIPNYFLLGQSAPCPPRVINFQNFTWGADSVIWTFPGGDPESSTEETQLVTYNETGDYSFTIEVFNSAGSNSFTSTDEITVYPNPTAEFDYSSSGLTVTFENLSEGELPGQSPEYSWDFGDMNTSEEENPSHTYTEDGTYEVTLTITNQCGTNVFTEEINVNVTGVEDNPLLSRLEVVPNPNNGQFELVVEGQKNLPAGIEVMNSSGQIVYSATEILTAGVQRLPINMTSLSPNLYFLQVRVGAASKCLKVLVD